MRPKHPLGHLLKLEACRAVGYKGHTPLMNKSRGAYSPSNYAPYEIRNDIFLLLMKRILDRHLVKTDLV